MKYLKIIVVVAAVGLFSAARPALAQGTAFTYQGRLNDGANPAAGAYDLRFTIYDSTNLPGVLIAGPLTNSAAAISNGLFTVTLDFGAGVFTGPPRWLEIGVRTNGGLTFATLAPRQLLTPTPYAVMAGSASNLLGTLATAQLSGTIPSANLSGSYGNAVSFNNGANTFDGSFFGTFFGSSFTGGIFTGQFIGDGSGLANLNASQLASGTVPDARLAGNVVRTNQAWLLNGNAGTNPNTNFIGTTDGQPLIIKVNGQEAERFEPATNSPNLVGGYAGNFVSGAQAYGVTIGGGGQSTIANSIQGTNVTFTTIGGGAANMIGGINAYHSVISGGTYNSIFGDNVFQSTIAGGSVNAIQTWASAIGGGTGNLIQPAADHATIAGGYNNWIQNAGWDSVIAGGFSNVVQSNSQFTVIGGGEFNTNGSSLAFIGGGSAHLIQFNVWGAFIGGGYANTIQSGSGYSAIVSGNQNSILANSSFSFIGSGAGNVIQTNAPYAVIGGGYFITNGDAYSFIGGGFFNQIQPGNGGSVIGGGYVNYSGSNNAYGVIGGGYGNKIGPNNSDAVIGGGQGNKIDSYNSMSTIGGGLGNEIQGNANYFTNFFVIASTIAGGIGNAIQSNSAYSTIGGGLSNIIQTNAYGSTVGGGGNNQAGGTFAVVPGGGGNVANGDYSFAAGTDAQAINNGAFVLADNEYTNFYSTASNQLSARFTGGVRFVTGGAGMTLDGQPVLGGTINAGQLSGAYTNGVTLTNSGNSFAGNGTGLTNVNAALLNGQPASAFAPAVGSTNYIQNQSLGFQNASFQISGSATVGGAISGSVLIVSNIIASGTVTAPSLIVSNAQITGLLRSGSESGTGELPNPAGLVVRRINSTSSVSNTVVAVARNSGSTANITLVRDGNNGGFQIKYPASPGNLTIACMGIDTTGAQKNFYTSVPSPGTAGTVQIYSDAQNIVHFECTFGITFNAGQHLTQVTLSRYGATLDNFWSGNLISTWNQ